MLNSHLDRLLEALWPTSGSGPVGEVFALLDGARDPRISRILNHSLIDSCCLYGGPLPRDLAEIAPYLVCLGRDSRISAELIESGWGKS